MKQNITRLLKGLKPLELSEYILFALLLLLLPWNWSFSIMLLPLLLLNTLLRITSRRKAGNPALSQQARTALWLLIAFYLYQVFTLLYSADLQEGLRLLWHRLPLLLLPLVALLVDTTYVKTEHRRLILWLFVADMVLKFLVRFGIMLVTKHDVVLGKVFDPVHHTYISLYVLTAIGFLYCEWHSSRKTLQPVGLALMAVTLLLLIAYLVMIQSRTGIVGLVLLAVGVLIHQLFIAKNVRLGLGMLFGALVLGTALFLMLPQDKRRMTKTLTEATKGDTSDARFQIAHGALVAVGDNLPFGVGIGDGHATLMNAFEVIGYDYGIESEYNAHNSYLDATLTMGLPGLLLLVALLALPAWWAFKERKMMLLMFLAFFATGALFEALLNRQMGILYFALFYTLLIPSLEHCSACAPAPHKG